MAEMKINEVSYIKYRIRNKGQKIKADTSNTTYKFLPLDAPVSVPVEEIYEQVLQVTCPLAVAETENRARRAPVFPSLQPRLCHS